jgi:hypothetical protein
MRGSRGSGGGTLRSRCHGGDDERRAACAPFACARRSRLFVAENYPAINLSVSGLAGPVPIGAKITRPPVRHARPCATGVRHDFCFRAWRCRRVGVNTAIFHRVFKHF